MTEAYPWTKTLDTTHTSGHGYWVPVNKVTVFLSISDCSIKDGAIQEDKKVKKSLSTIKLK